MGWLLSLTGGFHSYLHPLAGLIEFEAHKSDSNYHVGDHYEDDVDGGDHGDGVDAD